MLKYIITSFAFLGLVTLVPSCKKYLQTKPVGAVSDESPITDKASAETALRGVYRQLASSGYYGETYVTLGYFPGGDIKNLKFSIGVWVDELRHQPCRHRHHSRHATCKLHPDRMLGAECAFVLDCGATFPHSVGHVLKPCGQHR